jgi:hypothetical protein
VVYFESVDGKALYGFWKGWPRIVHVRPGKHQLAINVEEGSCLVDIPVYLLGDFFKSFFGKTLELEAVTAHEYVIKFRTKYGGTYWIEDLQTGEVVSGEKPHD